MNKEKDAMPYDEPPEPTDEEVAEFDVRQAAQNTPIRLEGLTAGNVYYVIRGILESNYGISERIDSAIDKAVAKLVGRLMEDAIRAKIDSAVDAAIADGFPVFDEYTGKERSRTSIAEIVQKALARKGDGWRGKGTLAEQAIDKAIAQLFEKELKGTIDALKVDLKRQADGVFQAKVVSGIKEALGLRS